jgi:hypothetical protein
MANLKRLTRRVEEMEDWIEESGDSDTMANYNFLIDNVRQTGEALRNEQQNTAAFKNMVFGWMKDREHGDDWNEYVKEQEDAIQNQQKEAKVGEETIEEESIEEEEGE